MSKGNKVEAANTAIEKTKRGFACMSPEKRRALGSRGGTKAQATGKVKHWTPEEAAIAGRKGGIAVSNDRDHMSKIANMPKRPRFETAMKRLIEETGADQDPEDTD